MVCYRILNAKTIWTNISPCKWCYHLNKLGLDPYGDHLYPISKHSVQCFLRRRFCNGLLLHSMFKLSWLIFQPIMQVVLLISQHMWRLSKRVSLTKRKPFKSTAQISLLSKGLNFCPNPYESNLGTIRQDSTEV